MEQEYTGGRGSYNPTPMRSSLFDRMSMPNSTPSSNAQYNSSILGSSYPSTPLGASNPFYRPQSFSTMNQNPHQGTLLTSFLRVLRWKKEDSVRDRTWSRKEDPLRFPSYE